MKKLLLSLIAIFSLHFATAQQESIEALMGAGTSLHDKGDYAGAIAVYDKVIGMDKHLYIAYEEKSLSLVQSGQYEACVKLCKQVLKQFREDEVQAALYINYATALDYLKQPKDAIRIYEKGIKQHPDIYLLYFNKGVTEYNMGNMEDAGADFKKSVTLMPTHAGSNMYLAYSVGDRNRVAGVMAMATFLILEPVGDRGVKGLQYMNQLLGANVKRTGSNQVNIFVETKKSKEEDNFHFADMALSLSAAGGKSGLAGQLQFLVMDADQETKGFFASRYYPFFSKLKEKNFLETAAHVMQASAEDAANRQWLQDNGAKVEWFYDWVKGYEWSHEGL